MVWAGHRDVVVHLPLVAALEHIVARAHQDHFEVGLAPGGSKEVHCFFPMALRAVYINAGHGRIAGEPLLSIHIILSRLVSLGVDQLVAFAQISEVLFDFFAVPAVKLQHALV